MVKSEIAVRYITTGVNILFHHKYTEIYFLLFFSLSCDLLYLFAFFFIFIYFFIYFYFLFSIRFTHLFILQRPLVLVFWRRAQLTLCKFVLCQIFFVIKVKQNKRLLHSLAILKRKLCRLAVSPLAANTTFLPIFFSWVLRTHTHTHKIVFVVA